MAKKERTPVETAKIAIELLKQVTGEEDLHDRLLLATTAGFMLDVCGVGATHLERAFLSARMEKVLAQIDKIDLRKLEAS